MQDWIALGSEDEFESGNARNLHGVTVFRINDSFHITETRCPHMGYPMSKGTIRNGIVTCAWHKWDFDLEHGGCYRGACDDLRIYEHKIEDSILYVNKNKRAENNTWQRLISEAMMQGDRFLLAKTIAQTCSQKISSAEIALCAYQQSFEHAVRAHQSLQAVRELHAIHISHKFCKQLDNKNQVHALLHGLSIASGPSGNRPVVIALPDEPTRSRFEELLSYYCKESSALGIERLLLSANLQADELQLQLLGLASSGLFIHQAEVFMGLSYCLALRADQTVQKLDHIFAPEISWILGSNRPQAQADAQEAMHWLEQSLPTLASELTQAPAANAGITAIATTLDPQSLADSLERGGIAAAFESLAAWLRGGLSPHAIVDAASLLCARRLAKLSLNNGGLWRDAARGLRLCASIRKALQLFPLQNTQHAFHLNSLFQLMLQLFETRWLQHRGPWEDSVTDQADSSAFKHAFEAQDLRSARQLALAAFAANPKDAESMLLSQLMRDDLDYELLACIDAVFSEIHAIQQSDASEWQPYIAGLICYAIDQRSSQNSLAAAQFGNSFTRQQESAENT